MGNIVKAIIVLVMLATGIIGFWFVPKSEMQTLNAIETPKKSY